jgi:hypothetical protein
MDLYLKKEDFKEVFKMIRDQFYMAPEYGGGDLYVYKYHPLSKDNAEFGLGNYDAALFDYHHPYDAEDYNSFSVRSLYEELILLKKNKVPEKDIIHEDSKHGRYINIGKMIEKRQLEREALLKKEIDQLRANKISDLRQNAVAKLPANKIREGEKNEIKPPKSLKQTRSKGKRRRPKLR